MTLRQQLSDVQPSRALGGSTSLGSHRPGLRTPHLPASSKAAGTPEPGATLPGRKSSMTLGPQLSWGANVAPSPHLGEAGLAERLNPGPRNSPSQVQKAKLLVKNVLGS